MITNNLDPLHPILLPSTRALPKMSNGWGNMGDLSAAKEFQQQVLRGDLNDDRRFRGGRSHARGGGDHMSFSFTRNSYGGGVNATGGNWDARLAKAPPAHLFATAPTARVQSNQPTLADDHGDPMIVDEEPDEPHSRLPKSCWGNLSTTTASTAHGTKDDTNITVSNAKFWSHWRPWRVSTVYCD